MIGLGKCCHFRGFAFFYILGRGTTQRANSGLEGSQRGADINHQPVCIGC